MRVIIFLFLFSPVWKSFPLVVISDTNLKKPHAILCTSSWGTLERKSLKARRKIPQAVYCLQKGLLQGVFPF